MKSESIVATTHIDAQNDRLTREALEKVAEAVNTGHKPLLLLDHDITIPPHGKMVRARVEARDDGEYQLVSEEEIFENAEWFVLDGMKFFREESEIDLTPFADRYERFVSSEYEISLDVVNFESRAAKESFVTEVKELSEVSFTYNEFGRKAAVPDPEIIIKLAETIVAYLLVKDVVKKVAEKIVDKMGDAIADDVAKFYGFAKAVIVKYGKYVRPRGRPVTYVFIVPRHPRVEFVARTTDSNLVLSAIMVDKLKAALSGVEDLEKTLGATRIQYLLNEKGKWEFNYLLTNTGGVVGTEKAFSNRVRKIELLFPPEDRAKREK